MKKITTFLATLLLMLILLPVNASAARTQAQVEKMLPEYKEWFAWYPYYYPEGGSIDTYLVCPEEDLTSDEIVHYVEDITTKLKGQVGKDETQLCICFPYSTKVYKQNKGKFEKYCDDLEEKLQYRWPYWSNLSWMDLTMGYESSGDEIFAYQINIVFDLNGGKSDYIQKLNEIMKEGKNQVGDDPEQLVNYFGTWLFDNVTYTDSLITNSAYVAVMEGEAVCGGFANAMKDFCDLAGIPCVVPTNNEIDHAWNQVYINGKWYTVDVVGYVNSKTEQNSNYEGKFLFDDPDYTCDDEAFLKKLQSGISNQTPFVIKRGTLTVKSSTNIKKYIGNLAAGATVTYQSANTSIATVDTKGIVTPGIEGKAKIKIKVVQNNKTYNLTLNIKSKFPKKGSKLTVGNGIYKVVSPAKKSGSKIKAGTVSFAGLSDKTATSFTLPAKIKIGKATYTVTNMEKNAFSGCSKLTKLTIKTTKLTKKTVGAKALKGINAKAAIKVPNSKLKAYKTLLKSKGAGKKMKIVKY